MIKLFLTLEDAVKVAKEHFDDGYWDDFEEFAEQEFEQKCYVSDDQYSIGYCDAIDKCIEILGNFRKRGLDNER